MPNYHSRTHTSRSELSNTWRSNISGDLLPRTASEPVTRVIPTGNATGYLTVHKGFLHKLTCLSDEVVARGRLSIPFLVNLG